MKTPTISPEDREYLDEYHELCHAMQSGVMFDQETGCDDGSPKHLRVGVNASKVEHAALVGLLIEKGVINQTEYFRALRDMMIKEVANYEEKLSKKMGKPVKLA